MLNEWQSVRPWMVMGKVTWPGMLALVPSARWLSPSSSVGRIRISRARCAVSAPMIEISDPVSSRAETRFPTWTADEACSLRGDWFGPGLGLGDPGRGGVSRPWVTVLSTDVVFSALGVKHFCWSAAIEMIVAPLFAAPARVSAVIFARDFGGAHGLLGGLPLACFLSTDFFEVGGPVR